MGHGQGPGGRGRVAGRGAVVARTMVLALVPSLALAWAGGSAPVAAQAADDGPGWLFPARDLLPDLLAGPRDPAVRGQLVQAWEDPTRYGAGTSGEVSLAATLPLLLLAGEGVDDALVVGVEAAAFARFSFERVERELVNTDWVFAVPLVWRRGDHWLRLRYYHASSHLGDEYARRFGEAGINFSRDAVDLTARVRAGPGVGVYGAVFWAANVHPEAARRWRVRGGVEVDPSRGGLWRPYLAADAQLDQDEGWDPRLAAQLGVWLPAVHRRPLRLALELLQGPSPMGQFHGRPTGQLALALIWNP